MNESYMQGVFFILSYFPTLISVPNPSPPCSFSTIQRQTMLPLFSEHGHGQEWNNIMMPFEAGQLRLCQHFHYKNLFLRINISVVKIHTQAECGSRNDFILFNKTGKCVCLKSRIFNVHQYSTYRYVIAELRERQVYVCVYG